MRMFKCTGICLITLLIKTVESALTFCQSPEGYLEVDEGNQNNTFTCSGPTTAVSIQWTLEYPTENVTVGTCPPPSESACSWEFLTTVFTLGRIHQTASFSINETAALSKEIFGSTNLICQAFAHKSKMEEKRCQFDHIYSAKDVSCQIQFNEKTWSVTGWCSVRKARSARGRYYCLLYQTNQQQTPTVSHLVGRFNMSTKPTVGMYYNYFSGTCQINTLLTQEGKYNFSVVIFPGAVRVSPLFIGNNEIRRPQDIMSHTCTKYIQEGQAFICRCDAHDLGNPPGFLMWRETKSPELKLDKVNGADNGTTYSCILMWNNTAVASLIYTLIVTGLGRQTQTSVLWPQEHPDMNTVIQCLVPDSPPSGLYNINVQFLQNC